jgi:hypothetical protein
MDQRLDEELQDTFPASDALSAIQQLIPEALDPAKADTIDRSPD